MANSDFILMIYMVGAIFMGIIFAVVAYMLYQNNKMKKIIKDLVKTESGETLEQMVKSYYEKVENIQDSNIAVMKQLSELSNRVDTCIQKVALYRYNPFDDIGGEFSFALTLLDNNNNGVIINNIYMQDSSQIYSKYVNNGEVNKRLSVEERGCLEVTKRFDASNGLMIKEITNEDINNVGFIKK